MFYIYENHTFTAITVRMMSMKMKVAFILIGALCLLQLSEGASLNRQRRDDTAAETIDKGFDNFKKGVTDLFKDGIPVDKYMDSISKGFDEFGSKVSGLATDFADSISKKTDDLVSKVKS